MYDKNNNIPIKDAKIMKLEQQVQTMRQEAVNQDREKDKLRKKAKLSKAKKSIKAHHQKTRQRKTTAPKK